MDENKLAHGIIGAAIEVHRYLGPGLLESAYMQCLMKELDVRGIAYESEVPVTVRYKDEIVQCAYRIDLLIENIVIVELKSVSAVNNLHKAQLLTYLRLCNRKLGLLLNFNSLVLKNGVTRVVNKL